MLGDPIPAGAPAPDFVALDHLGNRVSNETMLGQWVVMVFYPADDTPG